MTLHITIIQYSLGLALAYTFSNADLNSANAQGAAACFQTPARLSDENIESFLANPADLLSQNPAGGLALSTRVRALAGSSSQSLDAIIAQVGGANSAQKSAIGSGLARAARACAPTQPEYAALIQQKIAELNAPEVTAAFLSASNEVQTAALGGGDGGGAIGGGGGGGGAIGGAGAGGTGGGGSGGVGGSSSIGQSGGGFSTGGGGSYSAGGGGGTRFIISPTN
ncbi:hypothetical protein [Rhizobium halophytocola]|uniref:Uncharacterized protein n=1 Tax=Rhizobium halophytocola TaxID=735519 RepID=A0ABS4DSS4_9HYPH|nr:hypothetical protein [Rhizobium halophytocola]MBP1848735.1 hypothetical protein [Rhizobium halophytocola]